MLEKKNSWTFDPVKFKLQEEPVLDLSFLNEDQAGKSGFVRLCKEGSGFVLGNGDPVRFWAVSTFVQRDNPDDLQKHARFLAQRGVNMVRYHAAINPKGEDTEVTDFDEKAIDQIWKMVAAMKEEGIYSTISPYWAHGGHLGGHVPEEWGIEGYSGDNVGLWGLLFFNEKLQKGYKSWIKELYTQKNPYTGIKLANDPAVGIIQLQNEDSLLFWTEQDIAAPQRKLLCKKFARWLIKKYGSLDQAYQNWDNFGHEDDTFTENIVGLYKISRMTESQSGGLDKRLTDQLQFYAETMYNFNEEMAEYYREQLGCKQLINANNWKTADPIRLYDAERWTYTANEIIASNSYFNGGFHKGPYDGWRIDPGDTFGNISATRLPRKLPMNIKQVTDYPTLVTESAWVDPLVYQAEAPLMVAAYQSLTGQDGFYWFCTGAPTFKKELYHTPEEFADGQHPMKKWNIATPATMGNFPAAALVYRKGYINKGQPVVQEKRSMEDLWQRKTPIIAEDPTYDPNRDLEDVSEDSDIENGIDPLAYLVGPVQVEFDAKSNENYIHPDLNKCINHNDKLLTSITGEINLDYGKGLFTIDNDYIKGIAGFAGQKKNFNFDCLKVKIDNKYLSLIITSLDGEKLIDASKILIQVGTVVRPEGWQDKSAPTEDYPEAKEVVNTGHLPWRIDKNQVKISCEGLEQISKAVVIEIDGSVHSTKELDNKNGCFEYQVPEDKMYIILE